MKFYPFCVFIAILSTAACAVEEKNESRDTARTDSVLTANLPEQDSSLFSDTETVLVPPPVVFIPPDPLPPDPMPCPDCPDPLPDRIMDTANGIQRTEDPVLDVAEQPAKFPCGATAMRNFISSHIMYPDYAKEAGIEGRCFISFVVEKDGSLSSIVVVKSAHPLLDKEAIRVIKLMPNWIPASNAGKPVRLKVFVPVKFSLKN